MSRGKFEGYKVSFKMGSYNTYVYMKPEYYEKWKFERDSRIKDVLVEEVEIRLSYFLKGLDKQ